MYIFVESLKESSYLCLTTQSVLVRNILHSVLYIPIYNQYYIFSIKILSSQKIQYVVT